MERGKATILERILSRALVIETKQTPNFSLRFYFGNAGKHDRLSVWKFSN
jgi:hypothetical protein